MTILRKSILKGVLEEIEKCGFDQDIIDAVVRVELKDTKETLEEEIQRLKSKEKLEDFEKEDLRYGKEVLEGIEVVLKYYSLPEMFSEEGYFNELDRINNQEEE